MSKSITRNIIDTLMGAYLFPFKKSYRLAKYAQDVILLNEEEHLIKPVRFLKKNNLLDAEPVILDIGGAFGTAADYFLSALPGACIHIFEPNPALFTALKKKYEAKKVILHNLALSNQSGKITFHVADNTFSSSYKTIGENSGFHVQQSFEVDTAPLDDIAAAAQVKGADIIKLDVQGAELDVLQGGQQLLANTKLVIVEQTIRSAYQGGARYFEVDEFLRQHHFELLDIVTTYRQGGMVLHEFDSIYIHKNLAIQ